MSRYPETAFWYDDYQISTGRIVLSLTPWFYAGLLASIAVGYYLLYLFDRHYPYLVLLDA